MIRPMLFAALIALPSIAAAQASQGSPPDRVRSVTLKAGEKCPPAVGNEVVVCQTLDEPFRIPKEFRGNPEAPQNQSWANRAETVDTASREAAGLPDTCSPVGTGGQTGCTQQFMRQSANERRARQRR